MSTLKVDTIVSDTTPTVNFTDGLNVTGVATATNFKTGSTNVHNTGVELANINTGAGAATFGGQINVGTAATIAANGNATFSGIVTATTYYGSGTNLTGITGTTINNNANDRLITGSGTANTLEGESSLTYNGSQLTLTSTSGDGRLTVIGTEGNDARLSLSCDDGDDHIDMYDIISDADDNGFKIRQFSSGSFVNRLSIATEASSGNVTIHTGNLIMGTSGKGIDFGATSDGGVTTPVEILSDYEQGTWTPKWRGYNHAAGQWMDWPMDTAGTMLGRYIRVGNVCHVWVKMTGFDAGSGSQYPSIDGMPFSGSSEYGHGSCGFQDCFTNGTGTVTFKTSGGVRMGPIFESDENPVLSESSSRSCYAGMSYLIA